MNGFFTNVKKEIPIEGGMRLLADSRLKTGDTAYRVNGKIRKLCNPIIGVGSVAKNTGTYNGANAQILFPSNSAIKNSIWMLPFNNNSTTLFTVSGETLSVNLPGKVTGMDSNCNTISFCAPIGANKVLLRYYNSTLSNYYTVIFDKTTPGTVTTLTDIGSFSVNGEGFVGLSDTCFAVFQPTNRGVIVYNNNSPGSNYAITSLTNTSDVGAIFFVNTSTIGFVGRNSTGNPFIVIGTISGNAITWGSAYTIMGTFVDTALFKGTYLFDNCIIISFVDRVTGSNHKFYILKISISGTNLTMDSVVLASQVSNGAYYKTHVAPLVEEGIMAILLKNGTGTFGTNLQDVVNIDYNFNNFLSNESISSYVSKGMGALGAKNNFLLHGQDNDGYGSLHLIKGGEILSYANDSTSYEGIAQNDAFPGQPVVLKKSGFYSYGHKGLIPGTTYYVDTINGSLITTSTDITAGVAITDKILKVN